LAFILGTIVEVMAKFNRRVRIGDEDDVIKASMANKKRFDRKELAN
jgi:hypothetical protein